MSRRSTNFPPGIWQTRRQYDRQRYNRNDSNHMNSTPPHPRQFQNSHREIDQVPWRPTGEIDAIPWQPAGETMITRIWDIGGPPEEPPAMVRIITDSRSGELYTPSPISERNSTLTSGEQNTALNKLKKKVYDPPNNTNGRTRFHYRENNKGTYSDEEGKRCAVCLEDFRRKEEVTTTPCNHMFHEECIVPWVKSHGQCPNCRSALFERTRRGGASSGNTVSIGRPASGFVGDELLYFIRAMEDALMLRSMAGFWGA